MTALRSIDVVIEVQRGAAADDLPARRRLHAGREAALRDAVLVGADLLDRLAVEIDVGLERAEHAAVALAALAELRDADRVVERADAGLGVEHHAVGGDARRRRLEHHVALGDQLAGLDVHLQIVGEELLAGVGGCRARPRSRPRASAGRDRRRSARTRTAWCSSRARPARAASRAASSAASAHVRTMKSDTHIENQLRVSALQRPTCGSRHCDQPRPQRPDHVDRSARHGPRRLLERARDRRARATRPLRPDTERHARESRRQLIRRPRPRVRHRGRDERATRPAPARAIMPVEVLVGHGREHDRQLRRCRCPADTTPAPRPRPGCARRRSAASPSGPAARSHSSRAGHSHSVRPVTIASVGDVADDRRPALEDRDRDRGVLELVPSRQRQRQRRIAAIRRSWHARRRCGAPTSRGDLGDPRGRFASAAGRSPAARPAWRCRPSRTRSPTACGRGAARDRRRST